MRRKWLSALFALAVAASALPAGAQTPPCTFKQGFKLLRDMIPQTVGDCLVDERHNPANGDGLQETTRGLLVWRKVDNFTAFTDGYRTWVNGPFGLQQRLNTEKFDWEPVTPPAPPVPVAPPPVAPASAPPPAAAAPPTSLPAALEAAPTLIGPNDQSRVDEAAKLEWDWHRGLAANEEFVVQVQPLNPGASKSFWIGTREKVLFTPGEVLPPAGSIRWQIYVRVNQSETRVSQSSPERVIYRN